MQNHLHRWYDPETAKWLSEDPIGFEAGDANLTRWVGNAGTTGVDANGLDDSTYISSSPATRLSLSNAGFLPGFGLTTASVGARYTSSEVTALPFATEAVAGSWWYHGTSDLSGTNILTNGLNLDAMLAADPIEDQVVCFYLTDRLSMAASFAQMRQSAGEGTVLMISDSVAAPFLSDPYKIVNGVKVYTRKLSEAVIPSEAFGSIPASAFRRVAPESIVSVDDVVAVKSSFRPTLSLTKTTGGASNIAPWANLATVVLTIAADVGIQYYEHEQYMEMSWIPLHVAEATQRQRRNQALWNWHQEYLAKEAATVQSQAAIDYERYTKLYQDACKQLTTPTYQKVGSPEWRQSLAEGNELWEKARCYKILAEEAAEKMNK